MLKWVFFLTSYLKFHLFLLTAFLLYLNERASISRSYFSPFHFLCCLDFTIINGWLSVMHCSVSSILFMLCEVLRWAWRERIHFFFLTSGRWNEHKTIGLLGEDIWTSWTVIKPIAQLVVDAELSHKRHENLLGHLGVSSLHCNVRSLYACIEHVWVCMCLIKLFQGLFCEPLNNRVVNKEDGWKISENVMPTFRLHAFNIIYFGL